MEEMLHRILAVAFLFCCIFALFLFSNIVHIEEWIGQTNQVMVKAKEQIMMFTFEK